MTQHELFAFKSSEELLKKAGELGVQLPFQDSIEPLLKSFNIGSKQISNRMAVQPLEGFDGEPDGSPKVCICCSGCTQLMKRGRPAGCVVRDKAFY